MFSLKFSQNFQKGGAQKQQEKRKVIGAKEMVSNAELSKAFQHFLETQKDEQEQEAENEEKAEQLFSAATSKVKRTSKK
jgi:hypothetical protein